MLLAEARNPLVVSDKRTGELDRARDQKPVRWIAMFEMMQAIAPGRGPPTQRRRLQAGPSEKAFDPGLDRNVEIDPSPLDQKGNLPG